MDAAQDATIHGSTCGPCLVSAGLSMGPWGLFAMISHGPKPPTAYAQASGAAFDTYMRHWEAQSAAFDRAILWTSSTAGALCFLGAAIWAIRYLRSPDLGARLNAMAVLLICAALLTYAVVHRSAPIERGPATVIRALGACKVLRDA